MWTPPFPEAGRWTIKSAPLPIMESRELASITLEYRRECGKDSVLQSLTAVSGDQKSDFLDSGDVECQHMLQLNDGAEIVRGRTKWRPKKVNSFGGMSQIPAEST